MSTGAGTPHVKRAEFPGLRLEVPEALRRSMQAEFDADGPLVRLHGLGQPHHPGEKRLNVTLDGEHAAKLRALAERTHVEEGTLVRSLLSWASRAFFHVIGGFGSCFTHRA